MVEQITSVTVAISSLADTVTPGDAAPVKSVSGVASDSVLAGDSFDATLTKGMPEGMLNAHRVNSLSVNDGS